MLTMMHVRTPIYDEIRDIKTEPNIGGLPQYSHDLCDFGRPIFLFYVFDRWIVIPEGRYSRHQFDVLWLTGPDYVKAQRPGPD